MHQFSALSTLPLASSYFNLWTDDFEKINIGAYQLTILHTNDQHSRIDPFPQDAPKYAGEGGFARRAALIDKIRNELKGNLLLLDAGDVFQGTPYFNYFGGKLEFDLMSRMRYTACTIGNHDFDNGLKGLDEALRFAHFPIICSNYDFSKTVLCGKIKKSLVINKKNIRIGIYGLGINPSNLIPENLFGNTVFLDPLTTAQEMEDLLKHKEKCHLIICLSHLGYRYEHEQRLNDMTLAEKLFHTHLIIGGHTHTFMESPNIVRNAQDGKVLVTQAGWGGLRLGRIDFQFDEVKNVLSSRFLMEKIF